MVEVVEALQIRKYSPYFVKEEQKVEVAAQVVEVEVEVKVV